MAGTAPLKSLNAVTAPGNGVTFDVQRATSNWEVQITTTGSPASFACHLEGAIDGSTLVTIGSSITTTGLTNVTSNTPLTQVRLVLDSLTGGTAPTVTGVIVGDGPAGTSGGGGGAATIADGADQAEGAKADAAATTDTGTFSLIALFKRLLQKFTTQFPAALGGTTAANSFAVTLSTDGPFVVQTGAINETAPATDTASSGLNGRLQRIAQRLTSLIAQVPAALTGSGNLKAAIVESTATVTTTGAGGTFPVTNANLDAALSTLLPTTDFDSKTGSLTEAAPASDTASSGLNGRLQRVAQRLTSLIALLPASIGSKTAAGSLGVALATDEPLIGALTEAAPASDTASSGLNGRLQRIAQNITTMIAATLKVQGAGAAGAGLTGNPVLVAVSDATNAQTARQVTTDAATMAGTGILAAGQTLFNGVGDYRPSRTVAGSGNAGVSLSNLAGAGSFAHNGSTGDMVRNNVDATLLASAGRTTTQGPTQLTTYNLGAIIFVLDMTTVGTGSVTLTINEVDPASGKSILLLSGAAVVTNSTNVYIIDPMLTAAANSIAKNRITRTLSWTVTANNANSATYSLGTMQLVP
jgi:hypothetical protein